MAGSRVLVLGGGVGGMVTAKEIKKRLGNGHTITVLDRSASHSFSPSFPWVLMGWRRPEHISRPIATLVGRGVEFVQGTVEAIDTKASKVRADGKELPYDYLVLALGAELAYTLIPGLFPAAYSFYELAEALRLQEALSRFQGGRVAVLIPRLPYKCPAAPYEGALLIDQFLRKRGLRSQSPISLFTAEPQPLPVAGKEVGDLVQALLTSRDIGFYPGHRLASIDPQRRDLSFENGQTAQYDLLVAIPPHRAPAPVREAGLTNEQGWVSVDSGTLQMRGVPNAYALGDVTFIPLPSGMALPKAGVFAHGQGKVVAKNIAGAILGQAGERFNGEGACFLEIGFGKAAYMSGNFYAEPRPLVNPRKPSRIWHWAKVLFEKRWLRGWF